MTALKTLCIQLYTPDRSAEIADLFHQSVHAIDPALYTPEQQEAWAPTPPDYARWSERLALKRPSLAIVEGRLAGFIELDADGHIDCLYTHPAFQGMGVASALYAYLETEARSRQLSRLYVEASRVARPFFERRGFNLIRANEVQRGGTKLTNYRMEKTLVPAEPDTESGT